MCFVPTSCLLSVKANRSKPVHVSKEDGLSQHPNAGENRDRKIANR
jgi:hypothetical protein